jgi:hypothetical protein
LNVFQRAYFGARAQGPTNVDAIGALVRLGARAAAVAEHAALESPLHIAARAGRPDVVQALLGCGLPVLARTKARPNPVPHPPVPCLVHAALILIICPALQVCCRSSLSTRSILGM